MTLDRLARHRTVRPDPVLPARGRTGHPGDLRGRRARGRSTPAPPATRRSRRRWTGSTRSGLSFSALSAGFLLAVFIYWGWDSAVAANEETDRPGGQPGPRRGDAPPSSCVLTYVVVTVAAQAFAGVGEEGIGLANPENEDDVLSGVGEAAMGGWGVKLLIIAVLTSAAASTQTTILPTARATLAMAAYKALPKHVRQGAPALPDADGVDLGDGHRVGRVLRRAVPRQLRPPWPT